MFFEVVIGVGDSFPSIQCKSQNYTDYEMAELAVILEAYVKKIKEDYPSVTSLMKVMRTLDFGTIQSDTEVD